MTNRHARIPGLLLAALPLLSACGDAGGDPADAAADAPAFTVRDSAGVTIVENGDPGAAPQWTVSPPTLEIGALDAEGPTSLFGVADAETLPDGRIAVLNGGSGEVRIFEADGTFVRAMGRQGEGPGEFVDPVGLAALPGDSILVWDQRLRRMTVFGPDGEPGRITRIEGSVFNPSVVAIFGDGHLLVSDEVFRFPEAGYVDVPYTLARYRPDGTLADSLPGGVRAQMGIWDLGGGSVRVSTKIFGGFALVVGDADGYWVAPARDYEVVRHDPRGAVQRIVRWSGRDRTVQDADVQAYVDQRVAESEGGDEAELRRTYAARAVAEAFPAYQDAVPAEGGGVWVRTYERPRDAEPPVWLAFDAEGRLLARVGLPAEFIPREIGRDHVMGVERDELDVERLRRFRIVGGGGASTGG